MTTLLDWRRADTSRALWWRGSRVMLVRIDVGSRLTSQWFESEAAALDSLASDAVRWTAVEPPRIFGGV